MQELTGSGMLFLRQIKIRVLTLKSSKQDEKNTIYVNTDFKGAQGARTSNRVFIELYHVILMYHTTSKQAEK